MKYDLYKHYFENKKITTIGLGQLGRGVGDALFIAKCGAELIITDPKTSDELSISVKKFDGLDSVKFDMGYIHLESFEGRDMILKSAGVPMDNKYFLHAKENNIPIVMSAALVTKIIYENLHNVKVIGITGTRGKSTTTKLIYHIINNYLIDKNQKENTSARVHLGGNIRGLANLPLLDEVEDGDYVVLELDSWQLQGYGDLSISPHISVFTNFMPDHMNYYKDSMELYFNDKANIFKYQKIGDTLITNSELADKIRSIRDDLNIIVPEYFKSSDNIKYDTCLIGKHNQELISEAIEACKELGIDEDEIFKYVKIFKAEEGRLEYMGDNYGHSKNVLVYNDNNATTGDASTAAIESIVNHYGVAPIFITGGKSKGLDLSNYVNAIIKNNVKNIILLDGTGTQELIKLLEENNLKYKLYKNLSECVDAAFEIAKENKILTHSALQTPSLSEGLGINLQKRIILFSPAFASFSHEFNNEYERNDEFIKCVSKYNSASH